MGAILGGCLLSFQCCLRANGVILREDGVLPPRLKHHFNFPSVRPLPRQNGKYACDLKYRKHGTLKALQGFCEEEKTFPSALSKPVSETNVSDKIVGTLIVFLSRPNRKLPLRT